MKDKNSKSITVGSKCLIDNSQLGLVTGFQDTQVAVLVLADSGQTCSEHLVKPERITIV